MCSEICLIHSVYVESLLYVGLTFSGKMWLQLAVWMLLSVAVHGKEVECDSVDLTYVCYSQTQDNCRLLVL